MACALTDALRAQGIDVTPYWEREVGQVALHQGLRDATTDQLALIVASHPDDRYPMPAAYLRHALGWRVGILLMTRGEGGQNGRGPETGDELGWKRTLESEACAALLDAQVWYVNRQDAGFCRSSAEALDAWGKAETVRRVARLLRLVQPDVVLTTHHPAEEHGHDLALLEILPEAIAMAEDPAADADELKGLRPARIVKAFRGATPTETAVVRDAMPMEDVDPVRGDTYRRLAYAALKTHRSQEPIRPIDDVFERSLPLVALRGVDRSLPSGGLLRTELPSLFGALDSTPELDGLHRELDQLGAVGAHDRDLLTVAASLRSRLTGLRVERDSEAATRLARRLDALDRVIRNAAALRVTAAVPNGVIATPDRPFPLLLRVQAAFGSCFRDLEVRADGGGTLLLSPDAQVQLRAPLRTGSLEVTGSYQASHDTRDRRTWLERAFHSDSFEPPVHLSCRVTVVDANSRPLFPMEFDVVVPTDIRSPVVVTAIPPAVLLKRDGETQTLTVRVTRNDAHPLHARLEILGPPGFEIMGSPASVRMEGVAYESFRFELRAPEDLKPGVYNLHVHLGDQEVVVPVHRVDVSLPDALSVGLIPGVDDAARTILRGLVGDQLELLEEEQLGGSELDGLDTIVVDIRALREREENGTWRAARAAFPRLLEFVRDGGRLVVFYHKDNEFNVETAGFEGWPYPLHLGKDRVTREDAPVEVLTLRHRLLQYPNEIRPEDWDGWAQERGLYFPDSYAPEYEEIVEMGDPGQKETRAALLYARYGRGEYVYCALSLYRQLKGMHPGACRLFANLIASR